MNRSRASAYVEVSVLATAGKLCCKATLLNLLRERGDFAPIT